MRASLLLFIPTLASSLLSAPSAAAGAQRVPITIERHTEGAPITLGVPFPIGVLASTDHARVLDADGREIPAQVSEVTNWAPADRSVKWAWVFFFAGAANRYTLEFGEDVRRTLPVDAGLQVVNNPRDNGQVDIVAGRLHATVSQGPGGFLSHVSLDLKGDGFDASAVIATGPQLHGSFVDLLDDAGLDAARATVRQTYIERGSGPLHTIVRVEGEYRYGRDDNAAAPFVTRIHSYADRTYLRVVHTFIYTGVPDKHVPDAGEFPHIATQASALTKGNPADPGWMQPQDRIAAVGLGLNLRLGAATRVRTSLSGGRWWQPTQSRTLDLDVRGHGPVSVTQLGPGSDVATLAGDSSAERRRDGFRARVERSTVSVNAAEATEGWFDVVDDTRGVAVGLRHFLEEYPKEIRFDPATGALDAFFWSPKALPMSFARANSRPGAEGSVENWAQGLAKTSEAIIFFHDARASLDTIRQTMAYVLRPPVAHVDPQWYGRSGVYGHFAPRGTQADLDRAISQKVDWMLFNQRWAPWFGVFDYGDLKVRYDNGRWDMWGGNEPAQDFQLWIEFMRTGDARIFDMAQALSRHSMDVDNTHWPAGPSYRGESNQSVDYFRSLEAPPATKWLGIGRRHAIQHWMHVLSAHVWVQGWLADYYLAADHRGLDVARLTADMHLRHMWGEHEMTGRRLYLAVWNLVEEWDATKDPRYADDLELRVARMLQLQQEDADGLAIERYGYSQVYATHGLQQYLAMTGDPDVRLALVRHARRVRDVPPLNHWMESFLSTLHPLAVGYELTGDESFRAELARRVALLRSAPLPRPVDDPAWTLATLAEALRTTSNIPDSPPWYRREFPEAARQRSPNWDPLHGLRFFGWTHGHGLPWALWALDRAGGPATRSSSDDSRRIRAQ